MGQREEPPEFPEGYPIPPCQTLTFATPSLPILIYIFQQNQPEEKSHGLSLNARIQMTLHDELK
jgi:hypothetical protein